MKNARHPRILFICKDKQDYYGSGLLNGKSRGLYNSAKFVANYFNSIGIETKVVIVENANKIDKEVYAFNPTHVIIHAIWVTPDKIIELLNIKRYRDINWQI